MVAGSVVAKAAGKLKMPRAVLFMCVVSFGIFVRTCISYHPHSGQGVPPMFGDYEAQRHWMEITTNLPVSDWYRNTTDNDLQYWGLDYPPLTAYHSWLCGKLGTVLEPASMALFTSRGYDTPSSKLFMRSTVMASDLLVFLPAVIAFVGIHYARRSTEEQFVLLLLLVLQPALLLIDHGHFQYNGVALGFTAAASAALALQSTAGDLVGSILFVLALNFKQMSLYYALPFFFYLLGRCWQSPRGLVKLALIAAVVIATFAALWAPFLHSKEALLAPITRIFPFNRGLYEDKVANFWGATSLVLKWKKWFSHGALVKASLACTLGGLLPSCYDAFRRPTFQRFLYTLTASAFSFYLFSFQVHEKTILFPLLPLMMLCGDSPALSATNIVWLSIVATFSMYPLLKRDGLSIAYLATLALWVVVGAFASEPAAASKDLAERIRNVLHMISLSGMVVIHLAAAILPIPPRYPDIFTYLFVGWSFVHFFIAWAGIVWLQYRLPSPTAGLKQQTKAKRT